MSISWHEENIKNSLFHLDGIRQKAIQAQKEFETFSNRLKQYQDQVENAKQRGIKEFDRERFGIKRGTKIDGQ